MTADASAKELAEYLLGRAAADELLPEALRLIDHYAARFPVELGETVAAHLAARLSSSTEADAAFAALTEREGPLPRFVSARLALYRGDSHAALDGFTRTMQATAAPSPPVLLHRARIYGQQACFSQAAADLQLALSLSPPYSFYVKCEKLLGRILASDQWQPRRKAKLALLSSSTTALLAPIIRAAAFGRGLQIEIYEGVYGNYRQEILDPHSALYAFRPDIVAMLVNDRDLDLPPVGGRERATDFCRGLRELWSMLLGRNPCHLIQVGFGLPQESAWGSLEDSLAEGRRRVIGEANDVLAADLPSGVSFLDINRVIARAGEEFWSELQWHTAKQYPASGALPALADALAAQAAAALGLGRKLLAVDLDNTLWHGIIGEDLLGGIRIGPPSAEGEGHLALQKYLKELLQRGVLLAVCSKNNPADARSPFLEHEAMLLKLDDFAAFVANWQDKATNLQQIAADLSLGLDSFVFLDDNPLERALVRERLPQVAVPECGNTPWEMIAALDRGGFFEAVALTEEDRKRHASYRSNTARKELEQSAATLDDFLSRLEMVAQHGPIDAATLARATQLINKTNQFNLTTRRYTEEQVKTMAESGEWWTRWFRLADRFGDHGLIGIILARRGAARWTIDTWLMSCRVLGREMEKFMCRTLLEAARAVGAAEVVGQYIATEKNELVRELLPRLGFKPVDGQAGEYRFDLAGHEMPVCAFIRGETYIHRAV